MSNDNSYGKRAWLTSIVRPQELRMHPSALETVLSLRHHNAC
jgi:hypothetical protein